MTTLELVKQIMEICVIPLLGLLTKFIIDYMNAKKEQAKENIDSEIAKRYLDMIYETISKCVVATNQTYVEAMKKDGFFSEDAQKEAFKKTYNAVIAILSDDAKDYIEEATGDITVYLTTLIEAEVNKNKGNA